VAATRTSVNVSELVKPIQPAILPPEQKPQFIARASGPEKAAASPSTVPV
jgi:hypothetical protein